jgi:hypothetical protein
MKYLITAALLLITSGLCAQFSKFAEGPVFPYPTSGTGKILSVKDAGIMFLQVDTDSFIKVQHYDGTNHSREEVLLQPGIFPLKNAQVQNIFSQNGNAYIFISSTTTDSCTLYQLVVDGADGSLKETKILANLHQPKSKKEKAAFPDFIIRQSSNADAYAVAVVNPGKWDNQPVIQLSVFNKAGLEFKRPYKSLVPEKFTNLRAVDLLVFSESRATLLTYGYVEDMGFKEGDVIVASVENSKPDMTITELYFSNDLVLQKAVARYDSVFNKIFLLSSCIRQSEKGRIVTDMVRIDIPKMKIESDNILGVNEQANTKLSLLTGEKKPDLVPVEFRMKGLTNFIVIYQQIIPDEEKGKGKFVKINHALVGEYNDDYQMIKSYLVPFFSEVKAVQVDPFYLNDQEMTGVSFKDDYPYHTSRFLADDFGCFWIMNDASINSMSMDGTGLKAFVKPEDGASFFVRMQGDAFMPRRQFLAGKPTDKEGNHLLVPGIGYYDNLNGVWVTLQDEPQERYPGFKLVWLQP